MRQGVLLIAGLALTILALAPTASGGQPRTSCPNGFDAFSVPQTEAELRALPRIAAGLDADPAPYTVADLVALGNLIDANDDGLFCLKAVSNLRGSSNTIWGHFYWARDNDTAAS